MDAIMKTEPKSAHSHAGHRDRMKQKILKNGCNGFYDHEILEVLLFYAIPRRDTNQLAHELIEQFGSLKGLLEADPQRIAACSGMGESSAVLIKTVMEFVIRYGQCPVEDILYYDRIEKVIRYLVNYFHGQTEEKVIAMLFDSKMKHLETVKIGEGTTNSAMISLRKLEETAFRKDAAGVILAHNHPDGRIIPSIEDINTTHYIYEHLKSVSVAVIEHIVISGRNAYPIMYYSAQFGQGADGMNGFDEAFFNSFHSTDQKEMRV
jgi:DNA repair protein RadC